jgi:hypothetical protein
MVATLEQFINALRNELQQYGEMLALLESQQGAVCQRSGGDATAPISSLNAHSAVIESARRTREVAQRQLAWAVGVSDDNAVWQLVSLLPKEYRPLLEALVQEVQELLKRVRECASQNREHLRHSLELMEQFIARLSPPADSPLEEKKPSGLQECEPPPNLAAAL